MYRYMEIWHTQGRKGLYIYIKMNAPNAPNLANPNTQGQNADAEQGPANQAQGPAVQNIAQCPADQNQGQVPAGQVPA